MAPPDKCQTACLRRSAVHLTNRLVKTTLTAISRPVAHVWADENGFEQDE